jgi:hypothetical protein
MSGDERGRVAMRVMKLNMRGDERRGDMIIEEKGRRGERERR